MTHTHTHTKTETVGAFRQTKIPFDINPRQFIKDSFGHDLPIHGGWGYTKDDCVIIDKDDNIVSKSISFNGIRIEKAFVEKRLYTELIVLAPMDYQFAGIEWKLLKQELSLSDGKAFDKLIYEVRGFRHKDWDMLKAEYEGTGGYNTPDFDKQAHERKRKELMVRFVDEFWFEITSFFGKDLEE